MSEETPPARDEKDEYKNNSQGFIQAEIKLSDLLSHQIHVGFAFIREFYFAAFIARDTREE